MDSVVLTIIFAAFTKSSQGYWGAFLAGILLDIWKGNTLGISSAYLLLLVFFLHLYNRKFNSTTLWFLLFAGAISHYVFTLAFLGSAVFGVNLLGESVKVSVITVSTVLFCILLYNRLWGEKNQLV